MVLITANEDLTQASGVLPIGSMASIYEGLMDNALSELGRSITVHLEPTIQANPTVTNPSTQHGAYNPFFHGSSRPTAGGQQKGVRVTHRDVVYTAHIKHGPRPLDDTGGMGTLEEDEAQTTTVYESLTDIERAVSATIDGERFVLARGPRPIGFNSTKYLMCVWKRIVEKEEGSI